ncbi:MAG: putative ABC transporter permease [Mobilitalea sp.]
MKYTEIDHIQGGEILENPYQEVIIPQSSSKADSFINTYLFYRVFFVFVIGSVFGCYMEQILYFIQKNIWECRAGVIWGPFSEVYGFGVVLIYLLYQKMKSSSPLTVFCISTVFGSAFEYIARLFQEIVFHSITWDYSKQPFNLSGRTSLKYAICWGILGLVFIKFIFPFIEKQLDNIRGRAAFAFTWILIVFITINLAFSAIAVNRWNERLNGTSSNGYLEQYMDYHYGNEEMKELFPHMKFLEVSIKKL